MALRRSQLQVQSPTFTAHVAKSIGSIKPRRLDMQSIDQNVPDAEVFTRIEAPRNCVSKQKIAVPLALRACCHSKPRHTNSGHRITRQSPPIRLLSLC